ncbi:hypothetical protein GCM10011380_09080 [Sphingomonas metalli]|uniref:Helix-turn-helix domain-containing protein n=1 Tax=Sphingomonas metalli TaxID=1779358 RepID=A0A916SXA9_9SPHN|nr:helix-turn-helix domain-containing protein [Sphingomonas metalli]GGB21676.1 hypothetical protein GCM10011380_09080 [Sphingomonas metalli]
MRAVDDTVSAGAFVRPSTSHPGADTMSYTSSTGAPSRRDVANLLKGAAGALTKTRRGPDQGEGRRVPRRDSYDQDDPRAKPWGRIGDGTTGEGLAHREALLTSAEELFELGRRETPAAKLREARARFDALSAELDAGGLPVGRAATIRQELAPLRELIETGRQRLQLVDLRVLKALLRFVDFKTGRLFPAIEAIAAKAACHRNSVVAALRRLKHHGFIDWVRRTIKTGNDGEFAPQREQTSNAYFFDNRRRMAPKVWQRFAQILAAKMRRLGNAAARAMSEAPTAEIQSPALRAALARVDAMLANANT